MLWGREELSEDYATAYVEIAEWQENMNTRNVKIDNHIDYIYLSDEDVELTSIDVSVGPNPTKDFINIKFDQVIDETLIADIQDITGKHVRSLELFEGAKAHMIDVTDLLSSSYLVTLSNKTDRQLLHTAKILIAH